MSGFVAMAWTSLNEEASGYYQCLSVHQAGTGVSHPSGQVYRAGVQQRHYMDLPLYFQTPVIT